MDRPPIPLGISFFTFHAVSYLIDVSRGSIQPARNLLNFQAYFCMFPHLVAGPIVRFAQIQQDLEERRGPAKELVAFGVYRLLLGLNKKVLIANSVAVLADYAFRRSAIGDIGCLDAWLGMLAYSIQIYFDFSGYSDMAIGLAALAGFRFEENFRRPYSAASIRDFWRRWHISLSSWLRDYLYIPLGGSRQGNFTTYRNLLIVFILCGLWHGANTTFLVWGLLHGAFLVLERIGGGKFPACLPAFFGRIYALLVVGIGWVFFRADSLEKALDYLHSMLVPSSMASVLPYNTFALAVLCLAILFCLLPDRLFPSPEAKNPEKLPSVHCYIFQFMAALCSIALLVSSTRNPFIYFNF